jgi:hypothetical protein
MGLGSIEAAGGFRKGSTHPTDGYRTVPGTALRRGTKAAIAIESMLTI